MAVQPEIRDGAARMPVREEGDAMQPDSISVVTLTGIVGSTTVKQRAGVVASAVGSVVRVNNQIVVKHD